MAIQARVGGWWWIRGADDVVLREAVQFLSLIRVSDFHACKGTEARGINQVVQVSAAAAGQCDFTATLFPPLSPQHGLLSPPSASSSPLPSSRLARRHCGVRERERQR